MHRPHSRRSPRRSPHSHAARPLRLESLEERRLLAITVNTLVDENDGIGVGGVSLRDAVTAAEVGETIQFSVTGTIQLSSLGHILVNKNVTIAGPGSGALRIQAYDPTPSLDNGDGSRVFRVSDGGSTADKTVLVSGLTLTGGDASDFGGAIYNTEKLTVQNSVITGNIARYSGGGIFDERGELTVVSSTIDNNHTTTYGGTAVYGGGGILSKYGKIVLRGSTISNNSTRHFGGGVAVKGFSFGPGFEYGSLLIENCSVTGNDVLHAGSGSNPLGGGAVWASTVPTTITGSTITGNTSVAVGGGIDVSGSTLSIVNSSVSNNTAATMGGGIRSSSATVSLLSTAVNGNSARSGGGIGAQFGTITAVTSTISGNTASGSNSVSGGGIYAAGDLALTNCRIAGNSAVGANATGGGIQATGNITILGSTIDGNSSGFSGGGLHTGSLPISYGKRVLLTNCTISGNTAGTYGGGLFNANGLTILEFSTVTKNQAPAGFGSGVYVQVAAASSRTEVRSSIIAGNVNSDVDFQFNNSFASLGYNVIGVGSSAAIFAEPGDQAGVLNPLLGPLANNGGPALPAGFALATHALLAGSPAADAGNPAASPGGGGVPVLDARGQLSRKSGVIDVGAVEDVAISFAVAGQMVAESIRTVFVHAHLANPLPFFVYVPVTVTGTATAGRDFRMLSTYAYIPAGSTVGVIPIEIIDDTRFEGPGGDQITLTLQNTRGVRPGPLHAHTLTIQDNDPLPQVSFATKSQTTAEGVVTSVGVQISSESDFPVTVPLILTGSATPGADYSLGATSLVIPPGSRGASTTLTIVDDPDQEYAELAVLQMGLPTGATLSTLAAAPLQHVITIPQNDAPDVSFSVGHRKIVEGVATIEATVTLSQLHSVDVTVPFTVGGTAGDLDRALGGGPHVLVIPAGAMSGVITINVLDDLEVEDDETVEFVLGTPTHAFLGSVAAYALEIEDNSPRVRFATASQTVWEDVGTATFSVELTRSWPQVVSVPLSIVSKSTKASSPSDYVAALTTVVFAPGQTLVSRTVTIVDNSLNESEEAIVIGLGAPTNASLSEQSLSHVITINDNDPIVGVLSANGKGYIAGGGESIDFSEGDGNAALTLKLSAISNRPVTVPIASLTGAATAGADYSVSTQSIVIPAGQLTATLPLHLVNDNVFEGREFITLTFGTPQNALLAKGKSEVRSIFSIKVDPTKVTIGIDDNDSPPVVSFRSGNSAIGENAKAPNVVTVKLSNPSILNTSIGFKIMGTATRDVDYTLEGLDYNPYAFQPFSLDIPAGATSASFKIHMKNDKSKEADESIIVTLAEAIDADMIAAGKNGANRTRKITISDDDGGKSKSSSSSGTQVGQLQIPPDLGVKLPKNSTSTSSKSTKVIPAGTIVGIGEQGALAGATVFFDANFNGVHDFLDLDGDRIQDDDEPEEPIGATELDGYFQLEIGEEFDLDASGEIEPDEGRLVLAGGVDSSTGIVWTTRMTAAPGHFAVTPLTSLAETLIRLHGMDLEDAETRVTEAFGLAGISLGTFNPLQGIADGDPSGALAYLAHVEMYNTVLQLSQLIVGAAPLLSVDFLADEIYADLAGRIAAPLSGLNLRLTSVVADVIRGAAVRTGVTLAQTVIDGAAEVIAAGNVAVRNLVDFANPSLVIGPGLAEGMVKAKKVMQGHAAAALGEVGAGTRTIASVVVDFTGAALAAKIAASTADIVLPPAVIMTDATIREGHAGTKVLEFTVELIGAHPYATSVEYLTQDGTAAEADGDYTPATGVLNWAAGDNTPRTIQVTVAGDAVLEGDEYFALLLENNVNCVLRVDEALGVILNDDAASLTTESAPLGGANTLVLDRDIFLTTLLANDVVQALDGVFQDPLALTLTGANDVDDEFTLDFAGDEFVADAIAYAGGGGTGADGAAIVGGQFASIIHNILGLGASETLYRGAAGGGLGVFTASGLEAFSIQVDELEILRIELPTAVIDAILEDADATDEMLPGMMRLRSASSAFAPVLFKGDLAELRIAGGNATVVSTDPTFTGELDLGAALEGDFDQDDAVNGNDFLAWQRGLGAAAGAARRHGDANGDGDVDAADLDAWKGAAGSPALATSALAVIAANDDEPAPASAAADAVFAAGDFTALFAATTESTPARSRHFRPRRRF
jgi:hypothetical protein